MELSVLNTKGKKTNKKLKLNDAVFAIEPNDHAIYLDVKQHMANQRQGTHKTKQRGEVAGSGRKIRKQKGTGFARAGDIKNPIFRGGGRVFGPSPRDHGFKLNKKLKQLARRSALSYKAKDKSLVVLEDFTFDAPQTKKYIELLSNLNLADKKTLLVLSEPDKNLYLSSRNLKGTNITSVSELNTYDILKANSLLLVESSVKKIEDRLSK